MSKDWIQTHTGEKFRPLAPTHATIILEDIAHALSNICRYTGHVSRFYSVAEHSVLVSEAAEARATLMESHTAREIRNLARWGLLHDASEAYIADVSRPLKHLPAFEGYRTAEAVLQKTIAERFGLEGEEPDLVRGLDTEILSNEVMILKPTADLDAWARCFPDGKMPGPIENVIVQGLLPSDAKRAFLYRFARLWEGPCF